MHPEELELARADLAAIEAAEAERKQDAHPLTMLQRSVALLWGLQTVRCTNDEREDFRNGFSDLMADLLARTKRELVDRIGQADHAAEREHERQHSPRL